MIRIVNTKEEANCITHASKMHADDVFSTAFLELYLGNINVYRALEITKDDFKDNVFIYDIGHGEFDHHQTNPKVRENGITYCSFGLLWEKYGKEYLEKINIDNIDKIYNDFIIDLVEAIDADDNGLFPKIEAPYKVKTLSMVIDLFNVGYDSGEDINEQFLKAVNVAKEIIKEEIINLVGKDKAYNKISTLIENNTSNILILDEYLPYNDAIMKLDTDKKILLVIFPSDRGGYTIKTLSTSIEDKTLRVSFPQEWAGLINQDLEQASGIPGAKFCHNGLFIATATTKEAALKLAQKAIDLSLSKEEY